MATDDLVVVVVGFMPLLANTYGGERKEDGGTISGRAGGGVGGGVEKIALSLL